MARLQQGKKGSPREKGGNGFQHRWGGGGGQCRQKSMKLFTIKTEREMQGNMLASLQSWGNGQSSSLCFEGFLRSLLTKG